MKKMRNMWGNYGLFILAAVLLWVKSYLAFRFAFHLDIENGLQQFILFITPISSALFFLGFSLFFTGKARFRALFIIDFLLTFILYANVVYYRFFDDFLTVPVMFQFKNFGEIGGSAKHLMAPTDLFYILDLIILLGVAWFSKKKQWPSTKIQKRKIAFIFAVSLIVFSFNLKLAYGERSQLLGRTFDRAMLVKFLGIYNYHVYDLFLNGRASSQRAFADSDQLTNIQNYIQAKEVTPNDDLFGIAKGKNVIIVSLESTQNFLINYKLHDQEVTPFLNKLAKESFYFDNFYHNTGQGKTSDAEFMVENSLFGLPSGAVFTTNAGNTFNATPSILKEQGYTTAAFHGNQKSFWNRDMMYKSLGYDTFFSKSSYDVNDENSVNYGIKDIPFFEQSMPLLEGLKQPFYTKFITLTNHYPFILNNEADQMIEPADTSDGTVNRYFTTARYEDEAIKDFFDKLKKDGLYDNSVIILYGDHYGISENHNDAMAQIIGKPIDPYQHLQLQKVPFFIHVPGVKGKVMHTVGGEIDIKPTVLHLLGISTKGDIEFGTDLLAKDRQDFTVQRDGSVITDKYVYSAQTGLCYDKEKDGAEVDNSLCKPYAEQAKEELSLSDKVVYSDLLRFLKKDTPSKLINK